MNQSLDTSLRALVVLEKLAQVSCPQTLTELTQLTDIPKSSLMRLLSSLEESDYITRLPSRKGYITGPRAHKLGLTILQTPPLLRACQNILRKLVETTGETCNLNVLEGMNVQYLMREESPGSLRLKLHMKIGSRVPLHCTASGKLFLALAPEHIRMELIRQVDFKQYTDRTIMEKEQLESELKLIRQTRMGIDNEEFVRGMVAIAVPVYNQQSSMIAALACHAPTAQVTLQDLKKHVPAMQTAVSEIAPLLGADID